MATRPAGSAPSAPSTAVHKHSRPKTAPGGDEEATTTLRLGEFASVPTLSLSEARILIDTVVGQRSGQGKDITENE